MFHKNKKPSARSPLRQSQNTPAYSYYSSRSPAGDKNVGRLKKEVKKSLKLQFIPSFIALGVIVVSVIYVLILDTNPRITVSGSVNSALLSPIETYRLEAERQLKSSITSRGKLTINTKKIEHQLETTFPELADVAITIPVTGRRPIIDIVPVEPVLILTNSAGAVVLDRSGVARAKLSNQESLTALELPNVTDDSQLELELGKSALPADDVDFITLLAKYIKQNKLDVQLFKLPAVANELHLTLVGEGYYIKFNLQGDARAQAGTYLAVRDKLAIENIKPTEYIDVRVEEKAFYK